MQKLFSSREKKFLGAVNKSEEDLQQFLCDNWKELFPEYTFIAQEFVLKGLDVNGRIDIFAYNSTKERYVIFELKKGFGKYMSHQATYYWSYIEDNFEKVYLDARNKCKELPEDYKQIKRNEVEIVLFAKGFHSHHISLAQKAKEEHINLIKYNWFENDILLLDYVSAPEIKKEPTDGTDETKEYSKKEKAEIAKYCKSESAKTNWRELLNSFKHSAPKKKFEAISPNTKENIDKLRKLVGSRHKMPQYKKTVFYYLLNQLEEQLEQELGN